MASPDAELAGIGMAMDRDPWYYSEDLGRWMRNRGWASIGMREAERTRVHIRGGNDRLTFSHLKGRVSGLRTRIAISVLLLALAALSVTADTQASTSNTPLWGPYITRTTETSTVINWKTEGPTWGIVQYATEEYYAHHKAYSDYAVDSVVGQLHQVGLDSLESGETYSYRTWILGSDVSGDQLHGDFTGDIEVWLSVNGVPTEDFNFETLGRLPFTFIVYGDTQEQYPLFTQMERHKLVADYIAMEEAASFIVHVGDFTYDANDLAGWDTFFEAGRKMLGNKTIYPIMGNHENNSPYYYEIFGMPPYYQFSCGNATFTILDTNSWADFEEQRDWLEEELDNLPGWSFAFYHHPGYSSDSRNYGGWQQSREYWEDIFVEKGVTAAFSGHSHTYERYLVTGISHFVVGTGGGLLADLSTEASPDCQNRLAKTLGYAKVTVDSTEVAIDFIKVARVSDDNREVTEIYPFGTVFETVTLEASNEESTAEIPEGESGFFKDNMFLVIAVIAVLSANLAGFVVYRKYKARTAKTKEFT
jgi:hypothetical protein